MYPAPNSSICPAGYILFFSFVEAMHRGGLSVSNVVKTLRPWTERWINVAQLLKVPSDVISKIRVITTGQQSEDTALYKVVEWWFKNSPNPEWTTISEVVAGLEVPRSQSKCMLILLYEG